MSQYNTFENCYQFPGVADVVGVFAVVSESVGVPGKRGVPWNSDDLTAQREAAKKKKHHNPCTILHKATESTLHYKEDNTTNPQRLEMMLIENDTDIYCMYSMYSSCGHIVL